MFKHSKHTDTHRMCAAKTVNLLCEVKIGVSKCLCVCVDGGGAVQLIRSAPSKSVCRLHTGGLQRMCMFTHVQYIMRATAG